MKQPYSCLLLIFSPSTICIENLGTLSFPPNKSKWTSSLLLTFLTSPLRIIAVCWIFKIGSLIPSILVNRSTVFPSEDNSKIFCGSFWNFVATTMNVGSEVPLSLFSSDLASASKQRTILMKKLFELKYSSTRSKMCSWRSEIQRKRPKIWIYIILA